MLTPLSNILLITVLSCGMMSCASMKEPGTKTAKSIYGHSPSETASLSKFEKSKLFCAKTLSPLTSLFNPERPKIVKVRKENLKRLPTGHELAKIHQRKSRYEIKGGPINFQEPAMPDTDSQLNGSLLPPR